MDTDSTTAAPPDDTGPMPDPEAYGRTLLGRMDRAWFSKPAGHTTLFVLLAAVLIVPSVQFCVRIQRVDSSPYREGGVRHKTALGRWMPTVELMDEPDPEPYGGGHWFPLPPFILMCLRPLTHLGFVGAGVVWAILKLGGLAAAVWLLLRTLERDGFGVPIGVLLITAVFALKPVIGDVQHGNVNLFVFIWLALAWASFVSHKDLLAGLLIALAIVTKVTPGLALIYFAYKRAWRVCVGAAIGLVVVFVLAPSLWVGFEENIRLHQSWFDMMIRPFVLEGYTVLELENQSLYSVVLRLCDITGLVTVEHMSLLDAHAAGIEGMARPTGVAAVILRPIVSISVLGALGFACRTHTTNRRDLRLLLEYGMVLVAMLLLSERTWKHHATTLVIPYLALWYTVACLHWPSKTGNILAVLLGVQWLLLVGTTSGVWGDRLADDMMDVGVFCWGLVLCFVQTVYVVRRLSREMRPRQLISASNATAPGV